MSRPAVSNIYAGLNVADVAGGSGPDEWRHRPRAATESPEVVGCRSEGEVGFRASTLSPPPNKTPAATLATRQARLFPRNRQQPVGSLGDRTGQPQVNKGLPGTPTSPK